MDQLKWEPLHPPPLPPPLPPSTVAFLGYRGDFFRLVSRGAALELVTVGFYRFWLATDMRRHLWSNTMVDGDAPEYTGRGKELLIGFLFALAILMPVYLAYFLAGLEAERLKAYASLPLFVFFYVFGQFAIYRARRYRLTRTVWRGVRFWMDGSGLAYAAHAGLWALLAILTLGLILPWREAALERYKMQHSHYGDLQGSFEGTGWEFFKRGWLLWLSAVSLLVLSALARYIPPAPLIAVVGAPFIYGLFKAVEWRWWLSGIRFGGVRFESRLKQSALIGLYWKVIGWFLLIAVVFTAYLAICAGLTGALDRAAFAKLAAGGHPQGSIAMGVLAGIGYLAFVLALNVVLRVYLTRDLWTRVVKSTEVHGIGATADVVTRGEPVSAIGEGLADGLDVAGF